MQKIKKILKHFVSRKAMNIKEFGEKIIDKLIKLKLVKNPVDLYLLKKKI